MQTKRRVLIVEDDEEFSELLAEALQRGVSAEFVCVPTAAAAIRMLEEPDHSGIKMILLDIDLEVKGIGISILGMVAQLESRIPVIVLSDRREDIMKTAAYKSGAVDFMNKPVPIVELREKIANLLKAVYGGSRFRDFGEYQYDLERGLIVEGDEILVEFTEVRQKIINILIERYEDPYVPVADLARAVWGEPWDVNLAYSQIRHIRKDLRSATLPIEIRTVGGSGRSKGYRLVFTNE
jgi:DNA-binding response OmpR family regulator